MESTVYESIGRQKEKDLIVTIFDGKNRNRSFGYLPLENRK